MRWRVPAAGGLVFIIAALGYLVGGMGTNTGMWVHFDPPLKNVGPLGAPGSGAGANPSVTTASTACDSTITYTVAASPAPSGNGFSLTTVPTCWTTGLHAVDITTNSAIASGTVTISTLNSAAVTLSTTVTVSAGDTIAAGACAVYGNNSGCNGGYGGSGWGFNNTDPNFQGQNYNGGPDGGSVTLTMQYLSGSTTESLVANSLQDATFYDSVTGTGTSVSNYSSLGTYSYTGVVDSYTSLKQTYSQTLPLADGHFQGWAMTEDYFTQPGTAVGQDQQELSIQEDYNSSAGRPYAPHQNGGGTAWDYGVTVNDIGPLGAGSGVASAGSGTSLTIPAAYFADPATNMGLVAKDDPVSDVTNPSSVAGGTYVTAYNQSTGVITLNQALSGSVTGDTISFGLLWFIQDGQINHASNGTCTTAYPGCGQLVMHPGCDWNALPDNPNATGTIDTKAIVGWLETHAAPQSTGVAGGASWGSAADPCPNPYYGGSATYVQDPALPTAAAGWANYGYIVSGSNVSALGQGWETLSTNSYTEPLTFKQVTIKAV